MYTTLSQTDTHTGKRPDTRTNTPLALWQTRVPPPPRPQSGLALCNAAMSVSVTVTPTATVCVYFVDFYFMYICLQF